MPLTYDLTGIKDWEKLCQVDGEGNTSWKVKALTFTLMHVGIGTISPSTAPSIIIRLEMALRAGFQGPWCQSLNVTPEMVGMRQHETYQEVYVDKNDDWWWIHREGTGSDCVLTWVPSPKDLQEWSGFRTNVGSVKFVDWKKNLVDNIHSKCRMKT